MRSRFTFCLAVVVALVSLGSALGKAVATKPATMVAFEDRLAFTRKHLGTILDAAQMTADRTKQNPQMCINMPYGLQIMTYQFRELSLLQLSHQWIQQYSVAGRISRWLVYPFRSVQTTDNGRTLLKNRIAIRPLYQQINARGNRVQSLLSAHFRCLS